MTHRVSEKAAIKFLAEQLGKPVWLVERNLKDTGYMEHYAANKRERFRVGYET